MILATNAANFGTDPLGMVELTLSYLSDRAKKFWSKPEIVEYLNHAQLAVAGDINALNREFFVKRAETDPIGDTAEYSLPPDLIRIMGLEVGSSSSDADPFQLVPVPLDDRRFYEQLDAAQSKEDYRFYFVAGTQFRLMPGPATSTGKIRMHYVKRLARLTADDQVSEIPEEHHELVVFQACRRALLKKGQINESIERLYAEGLERMQTNLRRLIGPIEERVRPFHGSYGPQEYGRKQTW